MITQKEYDLNFINAIDYLKNNNFKLVKGNSNKFQYSFSRKEGIISSRIFKELNRLNIEYFVHKENNKLFLNLYRNIKA